MRSYSNREVVCGLFITKVPISIILSQFLSSEVVSRCMKHETHDVFLYFFIIHFVCNYFIHIIKFMNKSIYHLDQYNH